MKKNSVFVVLFFTVFAAAKPVKIEYYSFGDPWLLALDYGFSAVGLSWSAPSDFLSQPFYGVLRGSFDRSSFPAYIGSHLSANGLSLTQSSSGGYIITPSDPLENLLVATTDTILTLDQSAINRLSDWCNSPHCNFMLLSDSNTVFFRFAPSIRPLIMAHAVFSTPYVAADSIAPQQVFLNLDLVRSNYDSSSSVGYNFPSIYKSLDDLKQSLSFAFDTTKSTIVSRSQILVRAGSSSSIFVGQTVDKTETVIGESGVILQNPKSYDYGLTITVNLQRPDVDGSFPLDIDFLSSDPVTATTALKSSSRSSLSLFLGYAALVHGLTASTVTESVSGIPFVSDIPLLGRLFYRVDRKTDRWRYDLIVSISEVSPAPVSGHKITGAENEL